MLKKTELFKTVIPTKLLEYMACERPVIVAVDGQARKIVEDARAGVFVPPEDSGALAHTICALALNPDQRRHMGSSGRQYILAKLSREKTARDYIAVLENLTGAQRGAPVRSRRLTFKLRDAQPPLPGAGHDHGCVGGAIRRCLRRTSGHKQNVAFYKRHIGRLGVENFFIGDWNLLNSVRRLPQDPRLVQASRAIASARQRQRFQNAERVILNQKAGWMLHVSHDINDAGA